MKTVSIWYMIQKAWCSASYVVNKHIFNMFDISQNLNYSEFILVNCILFETA